MIAPIREPETAEMSPTVRRARRIVGSLLPDRSESTAEAPPVSTWKAWLFAAWVAVVICVYFAFMAGLL